MMGKSRTQGYSRELVVGVNQRGLSFEFRPGGRLEKPVAGVPLRPLSGR